MYKYIEVLAWGPKTCVTKACEFYRAVFHRRWRQATNRHGAASVKSCCGERSLYEAPVYWDTHVLDVINRLSETTLTLDDVVGSVPQFVAEGGGRNRRYF